MTNPIPGQPAHSTELQSGTSALAQAQPESLAQLFSRDPQGYTDQDLQKIVSELRIHRARMATAAAAGTKPGARPKSPTKVQLPSRLTEDEIEQALKDL